MSNILNTMASGKKRIRREQSPELKVQILAEFSLPGAPVAKTAMVHGINANLVHSWRKLIGEEPLKPTETARVVPIAIEARSVEPPALLDIVDIEL